jgi:hypothetical protein
LGFRRFGFFPRRRGAGSAARNLAEQS